MNKPSIEAGNVYAAGVRTVQVKKALALTTLIIAGALLVAASCSGGGEEDTQDGEAPVTTARQSTATTAEPATDAPPISAEVEIISPPDPPQAPVVVEPSPATETPTETTATPTTAPPRSTVVYEVQPGDLLSTIAANFGVTVDDILEANPDIDNPDMIFVGNELVIPPPSGN